MSSSLCGELFAEKGQESEELEVCRILKKTRWCQKKDFRETAQKVASAHSATVQGPHIASVCRAGLKAKDARMGSKDSTILKCPAACP